MKKLMLFLLFPLIMAGMLSCQKVPIKQEEPDHIVADIYDGMGFFEVRDMLKDEGAKGGSGNFYLQWNITPYIEMTLHLEALQFPTPLTENYKIRDGDLTATDRIDYYDGTYERIDHIVSYEGLLDSGHVRTPNTSLHKSAIYPIPEDYISYEQVKQFGEFCNTCFLAPLENFNYNCYMYNLTDTNGVNFGLYVDVGVLKTKDFCVIAEEIEIEGNDMRTCPEKGIRYADYNGAEYTYIDGKLSSIAWNYQDKTIAVVCPGDVNVIFEADITPMFSDYPTDKEPTILSKLMLKDTADDMLKELTADGYFE